MAMDYGPDFCSKSMGNYAIDSAKSTFDQLKTISLKNGFELCDKELWSKIQVTPMIGLNDTAPQNFSLEDAKNLREFSEEVGLGLLSIWSLNRDNKGSGSNADILHSSTNPETKKPNQENVFDFTKVFLGNE